MTQISGLLAIIRNCWPRALA